MSIDATSSVQQAAALKSYRPPPQDRFSDPTTDTSPTGASSVAAQGSGGSNPFAKLASDLQAALVSMQNGNSSSTTPGSKTASAQATPHAHGHHHHGGGGVPPPAPGADAGTEDAGTTMAGTTMTASTGQGGNSSVLQAFQAYASSASGSAGSASSQAASLLLAA